MRADFITFTYLESVRNGKGVLIQKLLCFLVRRDESPENYCHSPVVIVVVVVVVRRQKL